MRYQIGDFSKISRLSIKTLHFYHECGLLEPSFIDKDSGYRYYDESGLKKVQIITELKELDFPLKDIKDILEMQLDDSQLLNLMLDKSKEVVEKIKRYSEVQNRLEEFINQTMQEENIMSAISSGVIIKDIPEILIAAKRFKGSYSEVGKHIENLFSVCGRFCNGIPFSLYYDGDFKDADADIEVCIPIRKPVYDSGITCKSLSGGKALSIIHKGTFDTLGGSYKVIIDYINENSLKIKSPSREVYLKGPRMIFPRSPKKYVTEIQMLLDQNVKAVTEV